jgi:hypothetical protein
MKKLEKKLTLSRETIRGLQTGELAPVAGAATESCAVRTCGCPTDHYVTCGTQRCQLT